MMNDRKKIAIITPGSVPVPAVEGGAVEQLIEYFINTNELTQKYCIDVYTVDNPKLDNINYKLTNLIKIPNKQSHLFYKVCYKVKNVYNRRSKNQLIYSYVDDEVVKKYKSNYYDIVIVENNMDIYKRLYPKFMNEKIIFHLHNDFNSKDPFKTIEKTNFVLNTADEVWVVSNFLKEKLLGLQPNKKKKIKVVYNGIVSSKFKNVTIDEKERLRTTYNIQNNDIVFTFVGRLDKDKGVDKLIDAINQLTATSNIKCLIVGGSLFGTIKEKHRIKMLEKKINKLKSKFIFTGHIDNEQLYKIYSISDCVVIPTQIEEAFGVVALESMIMGLPVIASDSGGLPEILTSKCALFVKRNKNYVKVLSDDILKMCSNKNLRKTLGSNAKKRALIFPMTEYEYYKEWNENL
ncbi:glycosyltransferase family 4 protein [Lactobacillus helveticus]|uniref:glycosyltransferase family 4 protein n=1 Tax=Lactobacillus helveticus TaxID=1587 RepID=UPI001566945E|nr:glycosyltransferase family 4 protein [Lactobacillus helveticus]NRO18921.1 Spore coat protein SA [Lactobacillus helveticus]